MLALRRFRAVLLLLVLAVVGCFARSARADDDPVREPHTEFTALPIVGGSSDFGWGGGALAALARVEPHREPYVWRLEVASTTLARFARPITVPYQDHYLLFTLAQLVPGKMRLELRPSFTHEGQLKYSGLGNASPPPDLSDETVRRRFEYSRAHPAMRVAARLALAGPFSMRAAVQATYDDVEVRSNSVLARDRAAAAPEVRDALRGPDRHGVVLFEYALLFDTRDNEISTERGQYHRVQLRVSPGGTPAFPYRYGQANVTLRGFVTPLPNRLTFAGRLVGDVLFGDVPFYELPRYDDTYALGGGSGVRGVLAQRYYGKVKVFGNFEARTRLFDFSLFGKDMSLATVGFFDAGRLWFDLAPHPELDGTGIGLKYGVGGGLRLHAGKTFVVRADVAWSPDAFPIGAYFQANETF